MSPEDLFAYFYSATKFIVRKMKIPDGIILEATEAATRVIIRHQRETFVKPIVRADCIRPSLTQEGESTHVQIPQS
jgi:NADP-dependent 3-hydroxy acid dehydrogenase YdfG